MFKTFRQLLESIKLYEDINKIVAIYPGRFHIFHKGHKAAFNFIQSKYPDAVIATSAKVDPPSSPFTFEEKKQMMLTAGIPEDKIVLVAQPYIPKEYLDKFDPNTTAVVFGVSEKDMSTDPRFTFKPKKDGSPSYFQPLPASGNLKPLSIHGYIMTIPTYKFTVNDKSVNSASTIRDMWKTASDEEKHKIIEDLYGKFDKYLYDLFNEKLK